MTDFKPPIRERTTNELLKIVGGGEEKWSAEAVKQAMAELEIRDIGEDQIHHAKHLSERDNQIQALNKANEAYSVLDFIPNPLPAFIDIMVAMDLKKDGYLKKAEQQKILRPIFFGIILIIILLSQLL